MLDKPSHCRGCPLEHRGRGFAKPDGSGSSGILLLGESLGKTEVYKGVPFTGDAGAQLNRTLEHVNLNRGQFAIDNCIRCQPPSNKLEGMPWTHDAIQHCSHYTQQTIDRFKPKVVVPMGNVALHTMTGRTNIIKQHGYVHRMYVAGHLCYVVPTVHPSFIIQGNSNFTPVQVFDINRAIKVSKEGFEEPVYTYFEHPSEDDKQAFLEGSVGQRILTIDIETRDSAGKDEEEELSEVKDAEITRFSAAYKQHHAISLPWNRRNQDWLQQLITAREWDWIAFWNADFDVPRLKSKGILIPADRILDSMWMWHFLQSDLPKSLAFVTPFFTQLTEWKSLSGSHPEFYSCRDSDAQIQNTLCIQKLLIDQNRFDRFVSHYVRLDPLLKQMSRKGVLLDMDARSTFRAELDKDLQRVDDELQRFVPDALKQRKVYKRKPKGAVVGERHKVGKHYGVWEVNNATPKDQV